MQLFKTEMLFLHPPRTRRFQDPRDGRGPRYGGRSRCGARLSALPPEMRDALAESIAIVIARGSPETFERAA